MKEKGTVESEPTQHINPDYPIEEFEQDKFQRGNFAKGIARIINSSSSEKSTVLGVYGEWGSGKTSVLKLISLALEEQDEVVQIYFNPWRFHDEKELLMSFFFTLADSLDESIKKKSEKVGDLIKEYSGFLKPLSWFVPDVANPEDVANALGSKLSEVQLETLKDRIESILKKNGKKIVIYIDDIDRLNRVEIQSVFKLVKLTGNFANTHYVLAFDDKLVAQSLGPMFGEGNAQAGFNFLEKIIQTPLKLPEVQKNDLMNYCIEKLNEVMENLEIDIDEEEATRYLRLFWIFQMRLTTPRMAVRYANTIRIVFPMLKGEVNAVDLLLVEAIRIFYPELYSFIIEESSLFLRRRNDLGNVYDYPKGDVKSARDLFEEFLQGYTNKEQQGIKQLLTQMFPMFKEIYKNSAFPDKKMKNLVREMRISSPEHFKRYFSYTVLKGEIPDSSLREFQQVLEKDSQKKVDVHFSEFIKMAGADAILNKVKIFQDDLSSSGAEKLAETIAKRAEEFTDQKGFFSFASSYSQAAINVSELIGRVDNKSRFSLVSKLTKLTSVKFMLELYKWNDSDNGEESLLAERQMKDLAKLIVEKAKFNAGKKGLWEIYKDETMWLLRLWYSYAKKGEIKKYLKSYIDKDPTVALELVRQCAPFIHSSRVPDPYRGDLEMGNIEHIERYIELRYIYSKLSKLRKNKSPRDEAEYVHLEHMQNEDNMIEQFIFLYRKKLAENNK